MWSGQPGRHRTPCVRLEGPHARSVGQSTEAVGRLAARDLIPHRVRDSEQLIDTSATTQSVCTLRTSTPTTLIAAPSHQSLCDDSCEPARHEKRWDSHVQESGHCGWCVGRVNRGQDQVAGYCCSHRDLSGFAIANLTNHDNVGVLSKNGAQCICEAQARASIDLDLTRSLQSVFNRVFDRHDVSRNPIDLGEGCEQGRAFPAAGGSGREDDTFSSGDEVAELRECGVAEAQSPEILWCGRTIENAHDCLLATVDRKSADSEREAPTVVFESESSVLCSAPDRDVHPGQHLQSRQHSSARLGGEVQTAVQPTVDPQTDLHVRTCLLQVNVAGTFVDGLPQNPVYEPHDGRTASLPLQSLPGGIDGANRRRRECVDEIAHGLSFVGLLGLVRASR